MEQHDTLAGMLLQAEQETAIVHPTVDGDYIGDDGLLHCGKCHGLKQVEVKLELHPTMVIHPYVLCPCGQRAYDAAEAEGKRREKEQQDAEAIKSLRRASLMDDKVLHSTFASFEETPENAMIRKACLRYVDAFKTMEERHLGLLFWGGAGTGKTFAAACIANALIEKKVSVVMTSFVKLMSVDKFGDSDQEMIDQMNHARLLIIDDFGAERASDFALERVYNVIDSRYRSNKPLIITTNLSLTSIMQTEDERCMRIYDRVLEMCSAQFLFTGQSWRKQDAYNRYEDAKKILLEDRSFEGG